MDRFKKILFIADGSSGEATALKKILELARENDAGLTLMSVLPDYPNHYYMWDENSSMGHIHRALIAAREEELAKILKKALPRNSKLKAGVLVKEGTPHVEIIRTVMADNYDLLAKANHNDSKFSDLFFGTLDMDLLRKCPCPVYIMRPRKKIHHARILAAVDLIRLTKEHAGLDFTIMDLATSMARMEQGSLDVIHAWHLPHEKILKNEPRIAMAYKPVATMQRELRQMEKQHLRDLADAYPETVIKTHLVKGEPESVIPRFTRNQKIDLVVMGTVARTGIQGFFIGNTAEKILHGINTSVLAVKPKGFKTPVT